MKPKQLVIQHKGMIKEVTIYEATDGSRFDIIELAKEYENLYERYQSIMSQLRPHEDNGAVLQNTDRLKKVYKEFFELCAEVIPVHKDVFIQTASGDTHPSWAARIIDDYGYKCLSNGMFRLSCTNMTSGVEYEQPYYAKHEAEWKKVIY